MCILERFWRLKLFLNIKDFVSNEPRAFKNFDLFRWHFMREFIVVWNELANSIKLLTSALGKVHTKKLPSINLFQMRGLCGLMANSCFSMCAIKMTAKATLIFVPIAIPCVCR